VSGTVPGTSDGRHPGEGRDPMDPRRRSRFLPPRPAGDAAPSASAQARKGAWSLTGPPYIPGVTGKSRRDPPDKPVDDDHWGGRAKRASAGAEGGMVPDRASIPSLG